MGSLKGKLLVAGAALFDPHFRRAVVLVTEHDDDGALGLVLNRPAETTVTEAVPGLAPLVPDDAPVFVGGPVDQHSVLVVAEFEDPDESAATIFENVGFVRGDTEIEVAAEVTGRARVFAGYAGWSAGQLENEIAQNAWLTAPCDERILFDTPYEQRWRAAGRLLGIDLNTISSHVGHA